MKTSELLEELSKRLNSYDEMVGEFSIETSNKDIQKIIELIKIQSDFTLNLLNRTTSESKRITLIGNRIKFEQAIRLLKSIDDL